MKIQIELTFKNELTLKERLEMFLKFEYPRTWFSSLDVKRHYEAVYHKISLSTVSTYLARMYRDGLLERRGGRNQREYRLLETPGGLEEPGLSHPESE